MNERTLDADELRAIAEALFHIEWLDCSNGFMVCPGKEKHSKGDGPRDCKVMLMGEKPPTISCFHSSCISEVDEACRRLRSAIGKAKFSKAGWRPAADFEGTTKLKELCNTPKKPEFAPEKLKAFAARWRQFVDTAWLADRSPIAPFDVNGALPTDAFLRAVFREGEKVVCFSNDKSQGQALWPLQKPPATGDNGVWFLSQPVDGREHVNPRAGTDEEGNPKFSRRSEESVTEWRHFVLESDEADSRDWMAALVQLPLRIVAIYTSAKRSVHALIRVDAPTKQEWDNVVKQIKPFLVTLGGDGKTMTAVRLTRLPGCWREGYFPKTGPYVRFPKPQLQKLLFLHPSPEFGALCTLPKLRDSLAPWITGARQLMTETPATIREWDQWETVEKCLAALRWFESAPAARPVLAELITWMEGA